MELTSTFYEDDLVYQFQLIVIWSNFTLNKNSAYPRSKNKILTGPCYQSHLLSPHSTYKKWLLIAVTITLLHISKIPIRSISEVCDYKTL
jgi:hypothetical protein